MTAHKNFFHKIYWISITLKLYFKGPRGKEALMRGNFLKLSRLAFSHESELKSNMETHTEEQAFSCKNCGLAFSHHSS